MLRPELQSTPATWERSMGTSDCETGASQRRQVADFAATRIMNFSRLDK